MALKLVMAVGFPANSRFNLMAQEDGDGDGGSVYLVLVFPEFLSIKGSRQEKEKVQGRHSAEQEGMAAAICMEPQAWLGNGLR